MKAIFTQSLSLIAAALLAVSISSCQKEPVLTISLSSIEAPASGSSKNISVTSNYAWTATTSDSWIRLAASGGAEGTSSLSISVNRNETYESRTGTVTLTTSSKEPLRKTISVTQTQKSDIIISGETVQVGYDGGKINVVLKANVKYDIIVDEGIDWIKEVKTKALNEFTHTFEVGFNPLKVQRQAYITFKDQASTLSGRVYVVQKGSPNHLLFVHNTATLQAPDIDGLNIEGTVDWGDGVSQTYDAKLTHIYDSPGEYTVDVKVTGASTLFLNTLTGVSHIDISDF